MTKFIIYFNNGNNLIVKGNECVIVDSCKTVQIRVGGSFAYKVVAEFYLPNIVGIVQEEED